LEPNFPSTTAGVSAIPIKRRLLYGILVKIVRMLYSREDKVSLSESVDGNEGKLCDNGVHGM
jgi:hypothetical protein